MCQSAHLSDVLFCFRRYLGVALRQFSAGGEFGIRVARLENHAGKRSRLFVDFRTYVVNSNIAN